MCLAVHLCKLSETSNPYMIYIYIFIIHYTSLHINLQFIYHLYSNLHITYQSYITYPTYAAQSSCNSIPEHVRNSATLPIFKRRFKSFLCEGY